jgi:hypothetical protein
MTRFSLHHPAQASLEHLSNRRDQTTIASGFARLVRSNDRQKVERCKPFENKIDYGGLDPKLTSSAIYNKINIYQIKWKES